MSSTSTTLVSSPDAPPRWLRPSVLALLVGNVVPLVGVIFLHWNLRNILLLYWAESAVIGFYTVLKMTITRPLQGLFTSAFFCVHYGMFMAGHLIFLLVLTNGNLQHPGPAMTNPFHAAIDAFTPSMFLALLALFISHGVSFVTNFLAKGVYRTATIQKLMAAPYPRIIVMHITILGGAFLMLALGQPIALLIVMVILKTAVDLASHLREHRK
ncbi:MAG: DUF6498-containing protein [Phycisphaeraceae bacterium]